MQVNSLKIASRCQSIDPHRLFHCLLAEDRRHVQECRLPARQKPVQRRMHLLFIGYSNSAAFMLAMGRIDSELSVLIRSRWTRRLNTRIETMRGGKVDATRCKTLSVRKT
jgi:hypothetical protein